MGQLVAVVRHDVFPVVLRMEMVIRRPASCHTLTGTSTTPGVALRTGIGGKIKAHTRGANAETERRNAISEFGSCKKHVEKLCSDCDEFPEMVINTMERIQ